MVELEAKRRRRYRVFSCECDCGGVTFATATDLRHGRVRSCGCMRGSEPGRTGGGRYLLKA